MDIGKYIGHFILKNNFCYIHGLGNLELVKRPATHDGKSLQAPTYEVILTKGGSIDDSFANFIATNEQISISKAANALRDFSIQSRKDLQAGKDIVIEGLGTLREENNVIRFYTSPNFSFSPAGMPALKNSKQLEEKKNAIPHEPTYPAPTSANSINWSMVIIAAILLLILGAGGYGFYYYKNQQKENMVPVPLPKKDTVIAAPPPVAIDTTHKDTATTKPLVDTNAVNAYQMVVGNYPALVTAKQKLNRLKINGHTVEITTSDSVNYQLLETINCRAIDTTHAKDSIQRFFGYKNVVIYKKL
jgi:nucleoid DNA-binding protein